MTPERAIELAQLEPPRSIRRMAEFLDELAKRSELMGQPESPVSAFSLGAIGFNADQWVATTLERTITGVSRLQTWLPMLMREYQVELRDLREFATWLVKWNDKRAQVEVLRIPLAEYFGSNQAGLRAAQGLTPYSPSSPPPMAALQPPIAVPADARPMYVTADQQQKLLATGRAYYPGSTPQYSDQPHQQDSLSRAWSGGRQNEAPIVQVRRPIMNSSGYVIGEAPEPAAVTAHMGTNVQMMNRFIWTANAGMAVTAAAGFRPASEFSPTTGHGTTNLMQTGGMSGIQPPYLSQSLSQPPVPTASWTGMAPPAPRDQHSTTIPDVASVPTSPLPSPASMSGGSTSQTPSMSGLKGSAITPEQPQPYWQDLSPGAPFNPTWRGNSGRIWDSPELGYPQANRPPEQEMADHRRSTSQLWPGALALGAVAAGTLAMRHARASIPGDNRTGVNGFAADGIGTNTVQMPRGADILQTRDLLAGGGSGVTKSAYASGVLGGLTMPNMGAQQNDPNRPIAQSAVTPEMGMLTLMAPPLRVASKQAEMGGSAVSFDFKALALGAGMLDAGGLMRLKSVLPPDAQALYPAMPTKQLPANAVNLQVAPNLLRELLQQGYGERAASVAHTASRLASTETIATPATSPIPAQIVPTTRPMGDAGSILPQPTGQSGAGALAEAKGGQSVRGGVLDFLGMPVRLAPSLGGRSELSHEVDLRKGASADPGSPLRPEMFEPLRARLFPSVQSIHAEPDKQAWRQAAPSFGIRGSEATSLLAPDSRVPVPTGGAPMPQSTGPAADKLLRMGLAAPVGEHSGIPPTSPLSQLGTLASNQPPAIAHHTPIPGSPGHGLADGAPSLPGQPAMTPSPAIVPHRGEMSLPSVTDGTTPVGAMRTASLNGSPAGSFGGGSLPSPTPVSKLPMGTPIPALGGLSNLISQGPAGVLPRLPVSPFTPSIPSVPGFANKFMSVGGSGSSSGAQSSLPGGGGGGGAASPGSPTTTRMPTSGWIPSLPAMSTPTSHMPSPAMHSPIGSVGSPTLAVPSAPNLSVPTMPSLSIPSVPTIGPGTLAGHPHAPHSMSSMNVSPAAAPELPSLSLPKPSGGGGSPMHESSNVIARSAPDRLYPAVHAISPARPPLTLQASTTGSGLAHGSPATGARDAHRATQMSTRDQASASSDINLVATEVWSLLKRRVQYEAERAGRR